MRICIATDNFFPNIGGVPHFTARLAEGLTHNGHEVLLIAPSSSMQAEESSYKHIPVLGLPSFPSYLDGGKKRYRFSPTMFVRKRLNNAFDEFRPDVVHVQSHLFIAHEALLSARKRGIACIATNHFMFENLRQFHIPSGTEKIVRPVYMTRLGNFFNRFDAVTTPTETAATMLSDINVACPIHTISCGIDLSAFHPAAVDPAIQKKYDFADKASLLFVGRIFPEKRLDVLLQAVAKSTTRPLKLVIAGGGPEKEKLEALADDLGIRHNVIFTGRIPDAELKKLLRSVDCFVMPSTAELQSIATLEAMANEKPVIAANAAALPELVHDGVNGYLFTPDDNTSLASCIDRMFRDRTAMKRMGEESLHIAQTHDIDRTIEEYVRVYATYNKPFAQPHRFGRPQLARG